MGVIKVETFRLSQVNRVIQDLLRSFHDLLLATSNLVVKVTRGGCAGDLGNGVNRDSPGCHGEDPVVNGKLVLLFLKELLELNGLSLISVHPSLVLNLNDIAE